MLGKDLCARKDEREDGRGDIGIIGTAEARQEEKIGPDDEAGDEAEDRAARIRPSPDQAAEKVGLHRSAILIQIWCNPTGYKLHF